MAPRRVVRSLLAPAILLALSSVAIWQWPALTEKAGGTPALRTVLDAVPVLPFVAAGVGLLLGLRVGSAGLAGAAVAIAAGYLGVTRFDLGGLPSPPPGPTIAEATRFLLPLNLALLLLLTRRRAWGFSGLLCLALLSVEALLVVLAAPSASAPHVPALVGIVEGWEGPARTLARLIADAGASLRSGAFLGFDELPRVTGIACLLAVLLSAIGVWRKVGAVQAGFLGAAVAILLASIYREPPAVPVYFTAAGLSLVVGLIEASLSMAYLDDLTGLAGRRKLENELGNLGGKYSIAMIDVDHFKRFNDRHGHKTGDQVLRMIATRLSRMTGGARVFRYGGEEFTAVFPGREIEEAIPHLEAFRAGLAANPFALRSGKRAGQKARKGKGSSGKSAKVTVSVGVAASGKGGTTPREVLKSADKALYRAKRAGRNRLER